MTEAQVAEIREYLERIHLVFNELARQQLIGNVAYDIFPHQWPGNEKPMPGTSSKTGYGFTMHYRYWKKGNQGAPINIIEKEFNSTRPYKTHFYEHIDFYEVCAALCYIIDFLNQKFDMNAVFTKALQNNPNFTKPPLPN